MPRRQITFSIDSEQEYKAILIEEKFKLRPSQQAKQAYKDYLDSFDLKGLIQNGR